MNAMSPPAYRKKHMTSVDLAKLAGVSSATVSRAFSPSARINEATRARILSIAREHDYRPNAIASSLNSRKSRLVAVVVSAIGNPCEAEELNSLVHRLQERELLPIILCCADHADRQQLMRLASAYRVDHVVIFSDMVSINDAIGIFRGTRPIIVSFEPPDRSDISHIRIDGAEAAVSIAAKLVANGRRNFAYLTGRRSSWIDKQRQRWFADALSVHGLRFEAVGYGDYSYDAGFKEAALLLCRAKPDAIVCGNDVMAIGVCDAARRLLGKRVPEDIAVVGHDGIAMASWECHDLTTVTLDRPGYIDAIVDFIERDNTASEAPENRTFQCYVRWGATT
jgi:DNA-binding LacI/PurR family transcriptional regulator